MSVRVHIVMIILSLLGLFQETRANSADTSIGYIIGDIQENLAPYKVNVIIPSLTQLSSLAGKIVEQANEEFASANVDYENLSKILNANLTESELESHGYDRILERLSLTMAIVESKNESKTLRNMFTVLKHFHILNPLTRGKYLINLITEQSLDLEPFFRKAWSEQFLDLTVLEWIQTNESKATETKSMEIDYSIRVHSFNPFNDTFHTEILNERTQLFPDKVSDLYGHSIYVDEFHFKNRVIESAVDLLNVTMVYVDSEEDTTINHMMYYVKSLFDSDRGSYAYMNGSTLYAYLMQIREPENQELYFYLL
ncbi:hypothetical protein QAD02_010883 [Eretmocerus hayati]|uniref:Uncharacterized protein n=1 Tax=Eretmocerus hayati TaxID=131215 RepID=A0ACC2NVD8_9HYME|nr:hypothetical protein QAD02_010883 [Eretmocerus hayati]